MKALAEVTSFEQACLGAALQDSEAAQLCASLLNEFDFMQDRNKYVWGAIRSLVENGNPVDILSVAKTLQRQQVIDLVTITYLHDLIESSPVVSHAKHYCLQVKEYSDAQRMKSRMLRAAEQVEQANPYEVIDDFWHDIQSILGNETSEKIGIKRIHPKHIKEVLNKWQQEIDEGIPPHVNTPFQLLNKYLGRGFRFGEYVILGARPSVGKSLFALTLLRHAAQNKIKSLYISKEMINVEHVPRFISPMTRIPATVLRWGDLNPDQWLIYQGAYNKAIEYPLFFTDDITSVDEIEELVESWADTEGIQLLVVDYLQLISAPSDIKEERHKIEYVSKKLKEIAVKHKICVICISSLSRSQGDPKTRPTLSSLRESGQIEHDADTVLLMHRVSMEAETEVTIAKRRNGRLGTVHFTFDWETLNFTEQEPEQTGDA